MKDTTRLPELLAPAGDPESFQAALDFGADAVYVGGSAFSMRSSSKNFTLSELENAAEKAHRRKKKIYVAVNILPRNDDLADMPEFLSDCARIGVDALIISDLGVLGLARRYAPGVALHISTQAGVVNYAAASALYELGAKRVVLARELSLAEIAGIRRQTPEGLELEAFCHGAMCVSFSGRCLLSNYLTGRDANRGECAQPCRWEYTIAPRGDQNSAFSVLENEEGSFLLNSRDLCMVDHIPELMEAGVSCIKIEGRSKSAYYTAAVTNAYRIAVDTFAAQGGRPGPRLKEELQKVSHRLYSTGFYFGRPKNGQDPLGGYRRGWDYIARVESGGAAARLRVRNRFAVGDEIEVLNPGELGRPAVIESIADGDGESVAEAIRPDSCVFVYATAPLTEGAVLRRKVSE